jgi:UDP-N-acetylmuramate dehydrogenase
MALPQKLKNWLKTHFPNDVCFDEPMYRHTYYRIGGPADAMVIPHSIPSLKELVMWCHENRIAYRAMGNGSNILVKDGGIRGVMIDMSACANGISVADAGEKRICLDGGAGVKLRKLCRYAVEKGLGGMNMALGIPGTVGGAISVNAGTAGGAMADVVKAVRFLLPSGEIITLDAEHLAFSYRKMTVTKRMDVTADAPAIILEGVFSLYPAESGFLGKEAEVLLEKRRASQPGEEKSAGCFFKNPPSGSAAGRLIEDAGLKGYRMGGARVSSRHANFIINSKDATAADVIGLMRHVRQRVKEKFDITLEPEVEIIGDEII